MKTGIAGSIAQAFISSKLTPLLMVTFLAIGFYGTYLTPREEEPQIDVPMADIFIGYPGASPDEVKQQVAIPLEKVLSNIEGVEYVYSTSMNEQAMVSARFYVGEDVEQSLVRLYNELIRNADRMPEGITPPLIKTRSIDDVPMMTLTLWSEQYSDYDIRRVADELVLEIEKIKDVAAVRTHGGRVRQVRVLLDKYKMAALGVDPMQVAEVIQVSNMKRISGSFNEHDEEFVVQTGSFITSARDLNRLIIDVRDGDPIYLSAIADIIDGPSEPDNYVSFGTGAGWTGPQQQAGIQPAVTISISKRPGTDAMTIAERIEMKLEVMQGKVIPSEINTTVTRNYGETAAQKVTSLLEHLLVAIIAVTLVVALAMGWRGGLVVFLSVPVTFALTLFLYYMLDYTLNRITLFALVFVTGIVVDDSIIIAENMHRHFKMKKLPLRQAAIASINEVGNPTILATFTVIASVLPMAFVSGLMGPYMSPMPIGASLAMIFSLIVALIITPWLAYLFLANEGSDTKEKNVYRLEDTIIYRVYLRLMTPLLKSPAKRWVFIGSVSVLLVASGFLFVFRQVEVKMLPFDNKNEIQLIIDLPEGTTLERTHAIAKEIALRIQDVQEVKDYQVYAGTGAPINFNGLVRYYDLRKGSNIADIQLNLVKKGARSDQSHDIAKRIRPIVQEVGEQYDAIVKVVEVPPGPPVLSTLVIEVYGPNRKERERIGAEVVQIFQNLEGVVDVDWSVEASQPILEFDVYKQKAQQIGIDPGRIVQTVTTALNGSKAGTIKDKDKDEVNQVPILLHLSEPDRSGIQELGTIRVKSSDGSMVPLLDLIEVKESALNPSNHRKNQQDVLYVTAEVAGVIESPVYALLDAGKQIDQISVPEGYTMAQRYAGQPFTEENYTLKWDGEWQITYEVFRDLGIAFGVVLIIIYMLIIGWFQDFKVPIVMMVAIPLSLVGIILGHWILGAFFTATSMIGMIALAGIMVRNSVLLIDFIQIRLKEGSSLEDAVIEAGGVRTMPILLTAGTVVIGAFVILFDPIFQGLAISLMGGAIGSTALTLLMVPLIYFMSVHKHHQKINA